MSRRWSGHGWTPTSGISVRTRCGKSVEPWRSPRVATLDRPEARGPLAPRDGYTRPRPRLGSVPIAMRRPLALVLWAAVALLGAGALGGIALSRGEPVNGVFFVVAAGGAYLVAYRFYSAFLPAPVPALPPPHARRAVGVPAGHDLAGGGRGPRRLRPGLRDPALLAPARRQVARPDGARGGEPAGRDDRHGLRARDHGDPPRRDRPRRGQPPQRTPP